MIVYRGFYNALNRESLKVQRQKINIAEKIDYFLNIDKE